jgi:hypothetical protein
VPATVMARR